MRSQDIHIEGPNKIMAPHGTRAERRARFGDTSAGQYGHTGNSTLAGTTAKARTSPAALLWDTLAMAAAFRSVPAPHHKSAHQPPERVIHPTERDTGAAVEEE